MGERYASYVADRDDHDALRLVAVHDLRVVATLARVRAMSDEGLRELTRAEPTIVVEAAEAIIAGRRQVGRRAS